MRFVSTVIPLFALCHQLPAAIVTTSVSCTASLLDPPIVETSTNRCEIPFFAEAEASAEAEPTNGAARAFADAKAGNLPRPRDNSDISAADASAQVIFYGKVDGPARSGVLKITGLSLGQNGYYSGESDFEFKYGGVDVPAFQADTFAVTLGLDVYYKLGARASAAFGSEASGGSPGSSSADAFVEFFFFELDGSTVNVTETGPPIPEPPGPGNPVPEPASTLSVAITILCLAVRKMRPPR